MRRRDHRVLVVCDSVKEPVSLDPSTHFNAKTGLIAFHLFDSLTRLAADGGVAPSLAVRWRHISPTCTRFHLDPKARFHDGRPVRPEDIVFTMNLYTDEKGHYPGRELYAHILETVVSGPSSVDIHTAMPDGLLLRRLVLCNVVPKDVYLSLGAEGFGRRPVGTGPFRFVEWKRDDRIVLAANRSYFREGLPRLDKLVFRFFPTSRQIPALLAGEVDMLTDVVGTATAQLAGHSDIGICKRFCFYAQAAVLNNTIFPFEDIRARKALNLAIDRRDLIKYEARGNGRLMATTTMPGEVGHNPRLRPYPYDPVRARRLFDQVFAEHPARPRRIEVLAMVQSARVARFVKTCLARVGVDVGISLSTNSDLVAKTKRGRWNISFGLVPDPFCHSVFVQSNLIFSGSPFSMYRDADYDRRLMAACAILDDDARRRAFEELDEHIYKECMSLFLYQKMKIYAFRKGLVMSPQLSGMPCFSEAYWKAERQ